MNDNLRSHRAVKEHLLQICPEATGRQMIKKRFSSRLLRLFLTAWPIVL